MFELNESGFGGEGERERYSDAEEVNYFCNCSRISLFNFRHPAGIRQPHDMKTRQRWILLAFVVVAGIVLLLISTGGISRHPALATPITFTLDLEQLTDREKCPACFGVKMCPQIVTGQIRLTDWTKYKVSRFVNQKNVFYGEWDYGGDLSPRKVFYVLSNWKVHGL